MQSTRVVSPRRLGLGCVLPSCPAAQLPGCNRLDTAGIHDVCIIKCGAVSLQSGGLGVLGINLVLVCLYACLLLSVEKNHTLTRTRTRTHTRRGTTTSNATTKSNTGWK
jgi:hypothetical protein